ncbi:MAG: ABC transporter permease [Alphaproteobacteria bacterium]|nr:ABC transporter permease [Alphaproteobacteria bacterium]
MTASPEFWRAMRRYAQDPMAVLGAAIVAVLVLAAILAEQVAPYPAHAGAFVDFVNANRPPDATYLLGTDGIGRDVLSRIIFGYRTSLVLGLTVLGIAVPLGTAAGLVGGYAGGRAEAVVMRITDVFLALPSLVLAMAIVGLFRPSQILAMAAVAAVWWPWYARLVHGMVRSIRLEGYVVSARLIGASPVRIMVGEILPNCAPTILTKFSLDMGLVILLGASLSFLGLGAPAPIPDLGTMVADGANYLPDQWWLSVTAGGAIFLAVLGFNLVGDGLRDVFDTTG